MIIGAGSLYLATPGATKLFKVWLDGGTDGQVPGQQGDCINPKLQISLVMLLSTTFPNILQPTSNQPKEIKFIHGISIW